MLWLALAALSLLLLWYVSRRQRIQIPGPRGIPIYGVWNQVPHVHKLHVKMAEWQKEYGPVMYIPILGSSGVMVSSPEAAHEITVQKGRAFGGRLSSFRSDTVTEKTGILTSNSMDDTWKFLRKSAQRHLKQFGSGMSRLEAIIEEVGETMFKIFEQNIKVPFDPYQVIFDTALANIVFLITGEKTKPGDRLVEQLRLYEDRFLRTLTRSSAPSTLLVDNFPPSRYLGLKAWKVMQDFISYEQEIWDEIKRRNIANKDTDSLCKILMNHAAQMAGEENSLVTEKDARRTSMNLLLAGVTTTSNTFYAGVNVLAHYPEIQKRLASEVLSVCGSEPVSLDHRPSLPYCRAFLWELLRYSSVVALSVARRSVTDDTIQGYFVPKNTRVQVNIYAYHHDEAYWKDPEVFRPERFLDDDGDLVPADHPNRKHVMPFGAGPRVCLGESLALTRLFLWISTLVSRFQVTPAPSNDPSTLDTKNFYFVGVLRPTRYEVIFNKRIE